MALKGTTTYTLQDGSSKSVGKVVNKLEDLETILLEEGQTVYFLKRLTDRLAVALTTSGHIIKIETDSQGFRYLEDREKSTNSGKLLTDARCTDVVLWDNKQLVIVCYFEENTQKHVVLETFQLDTLARLSHQNFNLSQIGFQLNCRPKLLALKPLNIYTNLLLSSKCTNSPGEKI